jgi:hypothetical protein
MSMGIYQDTSVTNLHRRKKSMQTATGIAAITRIEHFSAWG